MKKLVVTLSFVVLFAVVLFTSVSCNGLKIKPVDEPVNIDLSIVEWMNQGTFKDLTNQIAQIIITDDMPKFQACEKFVIMSGTSYASEFRDYLEAILDSRETEEPLPVGGGKIWFVFTNHTGMFLEVNDNDDTETVLVRDSDGVVRSSKDLWLLIKELREKVILEKGE